MALPPDALSKDKQQDIIHPAGGSAIL